MRPRGFVAPCEPFATSPPYRAARAPDAIPFPVRFQHASREVREDFAFADGQTDEALPINRFSIVAKAKPTLHKEFGPIYSDYTDTVIDGPPRIHDMAKSIILAADGAVIPVQPSPPDVWATAETKDLVNEARIYRQTLKSVIAINRKIGNRTGRAGGAVHPLPARARCRRIPAGGICRGLRRGPDGFRPRCTQHRSYSWRRTRKAPVPPRIAWRRFTPRSPECQARNGPAATKRCCFWVTFGSA